MLKAMGAQNGAIRNIFLIEGILWALIGGTAGILTGALLCLGQQKFQWIKLQGAFIIDAYPVSMLWTDFLLVFVTVTGVGLLAAGYPAARSVIARDPSLKSA